MAATIVEILSNLRNLNIRLQVDGERLRLSAPEGALTPEIRSEIAEHKEEILNFLRSTRGSATQLPPIVPNQQDRYEPFPLTDVQQAYWIGRSQDFELGNVATHIYMEFEETELDLGRFEKAWQKLIDRHDMLRAVVLPDGRQQVLKEVPPYRIGILDLKSEDQETAAVRLDELREHMSHQVLPADKWPLFDIRATLLNGGVIRVHISIDLLIADALSWQILFRELVQIYVNIDIEMPPMEISFRDCVMAEMAIRETELFERALEYWRERIPDLPPAPELPLAVNPNSLSKPKFVRRQAKLEAVEWKMLQERATKEGITASTILMAAYSQVLAFWSKSPRFCINLTLFNRLPRHPQINNVVGDFTSLTLLEIDNDYDEKFGEYVHRLQRRLWQDLDNRYVGGVRVMREFMNMMGGGQRPVMPVVFTSDLANAPEEMFNEVYGISQTPQVWLDHQVIEHNGDLILNWDAVEELFPAGMLDNMFDAYCDLLKRIALKDETWGLSNRELIPVPRLQLENRKEVNAAEAPVSQELLHGLFGIQAKERPNQVAVTASGTAITYDDICKYSNRLGRWLRNTGAKPNSLVAVVMEKGWEQVAAVLGILKSGAAYLPISADLPSERINYLLDNGEVNLVLTQSWVNERMKWPEGIISISLDKTEQLYYMDSSDLDPVQNPEDLAYVIYTSGSTGQPKGVMIDHRGAVNTILDINRRFGIGEKDRVLALSALNFDLSVYDIFGTLAAGGTIVIPDAASGRDPGHWARLIKEEGITVWNSVPALMEMLTEYVNGSGERLSDSLRLVMLSGDWIPLGLPDQIRELGQDIKVVSLGGATEASIWSIYYPIGNVDPEWKSIPYGKPLDNQKFHVLDGALEPRPDWVPGQLYIGGIGLAKGYWRDKEKTDASFIIHPKTGERLYRTGDLGRYMPDGNIEFLGREDSQVKIQGYRIELGEIEAALGQHPAIQAGVVGVSDDGQKNKQLVAYIVREQESAAALEMEAGRHQSFQGLVFDPVERLKFKLSHLGHQKFDGNKKRIQLVKPDSYGKGTEPYLVRRTYRKYKDNTVSMEQFGKFIGSLMQVKLDGVPMLKSRYGSAGSLYPVQVYLYVKPGRIDGMESGTYYYHPEQHSLILISEEAYISPSLFPPGNKEVFDEAAFALFLIGKMDAINPLYGNWSRDFCMLEAGLITQLLEMSAPEQSLGLCQIGSLDFNPVRHWFALDNTHQYLHCLLGGLIESKQISVEALMEDTSDIKSLLESIPKEELENLDEFALKYHGAGMDSANSTDRQPELSGMEFSAHNYNELLIDDLRRFLRKKLPEYMVPAAFVELDSLPLTPNGKIDRNALPKPDQQLISQENVFVEPETELERSIASAWKQVLNIEKIGIHDSFFGLGGNSVDIVRIYNILRESITEFIPENKDFSLTKLFEYPTIHSLCTYLGNESLQDTCGMDNVNLLSEVRLDPEIDATSLSPAGFVDNPGEIFLTGASGFLGAHMLMELLNSTQADVHCLVRAENEEDGKKRLTDNLKKLKIWDESLSKRIFAVPGDLSKTKLGLGSAFDELAEKIDVIYHCAGWVNFVYPYEVLKPINVLGTQEILRLAGAVKVKAVHYVSSLTVFPMEGDSTVEIYNEDDKLPDSEGLINGYNQTKWVAEKIIDIARQRGIPVNVYRPSFISGHSNTGVCNVKDLVWAIIKGCLQLGSFTDIGDVQLVPVDYVSKAIVGLSKQGKSLGKTFHLIPPEPVAYVDIFRAMRSMGYNVYESTFQQWQGKLSSLSNDNALSSFVPLFMKLSDDTGESHIGTSRFSNQNTLEGLSDTKIACPLFDMKILEAYLVYMTEAGFIEKPSQRFMEQQELDVKEFMGTPYRLWNPFTEMDDFTNYMEYGPNIISRGDGAYVYNHQGKRYINAASSMWNVAVGHGREELVKAAEQQMKELSYSSCFWQANSKAIELSAKLTDISSGHYRHVFLGTTGSEAVETAIKMSRQYHRQSPKSEDHSKYKIVSLKGSYHGVSYGALSTSGLERDNEKFGPLLPGFLQVDPPYCYRCPYSKNGYPDCSLECALAFKDLVKEQGAETIAAFIVEPIMGMSGIITPPEEYFDRIGEICSENGILLIADEVTTGFGRTGRMFVSEQWTHKPDILCAGNGISSGYLPLSATMATSDIFSRFNGRNNTFNHGSTASGHPVCAAVGLANIDVILKEKLEQNSERIGLYLKARLEELARKKQIIGDIREKGLMIGIELVEGKKTKTALSEEKVRSIMMDCYNQGLLVYITPNVNTISLLPPLIIDKNIADDIIEILDKALSTGIVASIGRTTRLFKGLYDNRRKE